MANYTQHKAVYQNPYEQKIRQTLNADESSAMGSIFKGLS